MSKLIELAVRSWPADCRRERGDELVDTALEMSKGRSGIREALSLFMAGFGARYRKATGADAIRTWTAAARIALLVTIAVVMAEVLFIWLDGSTGSFTRPQVNEIIASGLIVAGGCGLLMTVLPPRLMAVIGTAAGVLSLFWGPQSHIAALTGGIAAHVALLWFLAWRNERPDPRNSIRFAALGIALLAGALAFGSFWYLTDSLLIWVTLAALVFARWDPRPLAGMCLHWLTRFAGWIPGFAADELLTTNVSKWYLLVAIVVAVSFVRTHRSINRAAVT